MTGRHRATALLVGGTLGAVLAWAPAGAHATFPGRNGQLTVSVERGDCPTNGDQECGDLNFEIVGIDPRTGRRTGLDVCPSRRFCEDRGGAWSPDGRWIAFSRPGASGDGYRDVLIATPDGLMARAVLPYASRASWSPDGQRLVAERAVGDENALFVTGLDGSGPVRLTSGAGYEADWSSRDRIVFDRGSDLYSISPDGTGLRRLTRVREQFSAQTPSWSPDGRRLAFMRFTPPERERPPSVYTMRASGGGKRYVAANGLWPTWSPDGRWIAFLRRQTIYVVRPDGSDLRRVRHIRGVVWDLAWQPRP
jgi:Tol biopolymer transport system component